MSGITDTGVFCGCWPFRANSRRNVVEVKEVLQANGVTQAWMTAVEAILCPEPMEANEPMFEAVRGDEFFVPVGTINVQMATFLSDAEACLNKGGARALKLFPNYHQYELEDQRVSELAALAAEAKVPVCIQVNMLDQRAQHKLLIVEPVPPRAIVALAEANPDTRFLVCCGPKNGLGAYAEAPQTLRDDVAALSPDRIVFGSHTPIFYTAAAVAKPDPADSAVSPAVIEAVGWQNAERLLSGN